MSSNGPFTEGDWKYLRSIQAELLDALCHRINQKTIEIVSSGKGPEIETYRSVFRHMKESDDIVARCFDDWRRSTIALRALCMHRERLLSEHHVNKLSLTAQAVLRDFPR